MKLKTKYRPELICSKDETRAVLQNAELTELDGKTSLVATDGRRLLVLPVEADSKEYGPVPPVAFKLARQHRSSKMADVVQITLNGKVEFENGWTIPRPEQLKFPNVKTVIPEQPPRYRVCISAKYLHEIANSLGVDQVILEIRDANDPLTIRAQHEEGFAVLMPVRIS